MPPNGSEIKDNNAVNETLQSELDIKKLNQVGDTDNLAENLKNKDIKSPAAKEAEEEKDKIDNKSETSDKDFDLSTDLLIQTIVNLRLNPDFNPTNNAKGLSETNEYRKNILLTSDIDSLKRYIAYYNAQTMINNYHNKTSAPTIDMDQYIAKFEPISIAHKQEIINSQPAGEEKLEDLNGFPLTTESRIGQFIQMSPSDVDRINNKFDEIIDNNIELGVITLVGKADATPVRETTESINNLKKNYNDQRQLLINKGMDQAWMDKNFPADFLNQPNPSQEELKQSYAYIRAMLQIGVLEPKHIDYIVKNSKEIKVNTIVSDKIGNEYTGQQIDAQIFSSENTTSKEFKELFLKEFQKLHVNYVVPLNNGKLQIVQGISVYNENIKDPKDNTLKVFASKGTIFGTTPAITKHKLQGNKTGTYRMPNTPGEVLYIVLDPTDSRIKQESKENGTMVRNEFTKKMEPAKSRYLSMDINPTLDDFQKVLEEFKNSATEPSDEKDHADNLISMMGTYRELIKEEKGMIMTI